ARRNAIRRNHTATHILQKSLRETLGSHVGQQGSLVAPDRLRFDFSHSAALTPDEIAQVTDAMNDAILANYPVSIAQRAYKEALAAGAMAFFSEKYGDVVRVVSIGDEDQPAFSMELCGGTHVDATGDIGQALVVSESAVASGVRRIEVVTGRGALELARGQQKQLVEISRTLNTSPDKAAEQTKHVMAQLSETQKALDKAQKELIRYRFNDTLAKTETLNGVPVLIARVEVDGADRLREMSDWFREKHQSGVVVLGAVSADKPALLVGVSQDLNKRGIEAGKLIKEIAAIVGGSGGGRPTLAQAGGKDPARLDEALEKARTTLEKTING
ncbi:MAG: DHHA1 domain-containing protein, partial [Anaerolineae bacterium]